MVPLLLSWQIGQPLRAATIIWDAGSSSDFAWDTASNWSPDGVPTSADDVQFAAVIPNPGVLLNPSILTLGSSEVANSLFFQNNYTLTGGDLTLTSGRIQTDSSMSGVYGTIGSTIHGTAGLIKSGLGTIVLTGINDYTGQTVIEQGTVVINSASALGADTSAIIINGFANRSVQGGQLYVAGSLTSGITISRAIALSGRGPTSDGAALVSAGNNTFSGNIFSSSLGEGRMASAYGTMTITGNVDGTASNNNVVFVGNGNFLVSGQIGASSNPYSTATGVVKGGTGTLILTNANNTNLGRWQIDAGSIRVSTGGNLGITTRSDGVLPNTGFLEVRTDAGNTFSTLNVQANNSSTALFVDHAFSGTGSLNQTVVLNSYQSNNNIASTATGRNGTNLTVGTLTEAGAANAVGITWSGNGLLTAASYATTSTTASQTITLTQTGDMLVTTAFNPITATTGTVFTQAGTGMLTVLGTNGGTAGFAWRIGNGTLSVASSAASTTTGINIGNASTTAGVLNYLGAGGGALYGGTGAGETWSKPILINVTTASDMITANQSGSTPTALTISGAISSITTTGSLYLAGSSTLDNTISSALPAGASGMSLGKSGLGTWVLSGNNAYTGLTAIYGGTLKIDASAATGVSTKLADGGAIVFNADVTTAAASATANTGGFTGNQTAGGTLIYKGSASAGGSQEVVGALTPVVGSANIMIDNSSASGTLLKFASLAARGAGSTVNFDQGGNGGGIQFSTTAPPLQNGIIAGAYMTNRSALGVITGVDFATVATTGANISAPTYTALPSTVTTNTVNYNLTGSQTTVADVVNSLKIAPASGAGTTTLTLGGALTFFAGAAGNILFDNTNAATNITGSFAVGTAAQELIITTAGNNAANALTFNSTTTTIGTTSGVLTKAGSGLLVLQGNSSAFTGNVNINEGTLQLSGATANLLGTIATAANITSIRQTATLDIGGAGVAAAPYGTATSLGTVNIGSLSGGGANIPSIAKITTVSGATTNSTTVVVADATNIKLGQTVTGVGAGVGGYAIVTGISGTTITLSSPQTLANGASLNFVQYSTTGATVTNSGSASAISLGVSTSTGINTFNGLIKDGAGATTVIVNGTSTRVQTLTGYNTYTGATIISGGSTLRVTNLANGGVASAIGASTNAAGNLVFNNGVLQYAGQNATTYQNTETPSVSIDRLFTIAGNATIDSSGTFGTAVLATATQDNAALIFSNTGAVSYASTTAAARTLTLMGTSTGDNEIDLQLINNPTNPTVNTLGITKGAGSGLWILGNGSNSYTGLTTISAGQLRAQDGASLPTSSPVFFTGGVLETSGSFTRTVLSTAPTATSANGGVFWSTGGGFAASTAKLTVNLTGPNGTNPLKWAGTGADLGFVANGQALVLGSSTSLFETEFQNNIDLNGAVRTITVNDNATTGADFTTISGVISNSTGTSGLIIAANAPTIFTAANTYNGTTNISAGELRVFSLGNSVTNPGAATSVGIASAATTSAIIFGNTTTTGATLTYLGAGETSDRALSSFSTTGGIGIDSSGTGPLVLTGTFTNTNNTTSAPKTLSLNGLNTDFNTLASDLTDNTNKSIGGALGITKNSAGVWILTGNNAISGTITLSGGILGVGSDTALGTGPITWNNGMLMAVNADRTLANVTTLVNNTTWGVLGNYSLNFSSNVNWGTGANSNTFSNNIIAGKSLTFNGGFTSTMTAAGQTISFNGSGATVINGAIQQSFNSGMTYAGSVGGSFTFGGSGTNTITGTFTQSSGTLNINRVGAFTSWSNYLLSAGYLQNTSGTALTGANALMLSTLTTGANSGAANIFNLNGNQIYLLGSGAAASIEFAGQFNNAGAANRILYDQMTGSAALVLSGTINLSSDTTARILTINGTGTGPINLTGVVLPTSSATPGALIGGTLIKGALGDLNIAPTSTLNAPTNGNLVITGGTATFNQASTQSFSLQKIDVASNAALNVDYQTNNVTTSVGANSGAYRTINLIGGSLNFTANTTTGTTETLGGLQLGFASANLPFSSTGMSTLNFTNGGSNASSLSFAQLNPSATGGTLNIVASSLGTTNKIFLPGLLTNASFGTNARVTINGTEYATQSANGLVAFNNYVTGNNLDSTQTLVILPQIDNFNLSATPTFSGKTVTGLTKTVNNLKISGNNIDVGSGTSLFQLTLGGGGVLASGTGNVISVPVLSLGSEGVVNVVGSGSDLTISSALTGAVPFNKTGDGKLTLSSTEYYTSSTVVSGGSLVLGASNILPNFQTATVPTVQNLHVNYGATVDMNGTNQFIGTLNDNNGLQGSAGTVTNTAAGAANLYMNSAGATFGGVITNTGGALSLYKYGNSTESFTSNNTYTGSTNIVGGTIALIDGGRLSNTSGFNISYGGVIQFSNLGNQDLSNRVNASASYTLNGGTVRLDGSANNISQQSIGAISALSGVNTIAANVNGAGGAFLTVASLARSTGATVNFSGSTLGVLYNNTQSGRIILTSAPALTNNIIGGWATLGGTEFATYISAVDTSITPSLAQGVTTLQLYVTTSDPTWTSVDNVKMANNSSASPAVYTLGGSRTINSLNIQSTTNGITINNPGTLTLGSGGLLSNGVANTLAGGVLTAGLTSSAAELFLLSNIATTITSQITNNTAGGVVSVVSGLAGVVTTLSPTVSNTYGGLTTVNAGTLTIGSNAGIIGIPGDLVVNNAAVTFTQLQQIASGKNLTINGAGGSVTFAGSGNNVLGAVTFMNNGANTTPTITGGTIVISSLTSQNDNLAATPTVASILDLNGSSLTITTSGLSLVDLSITGVIQSGGVNGTGSGQLIKAGAGSLVLTGANTFTGGIALNNGTLIINSSASALGTGALSMADGTTLMSGTASVTPLNQINVNGNISLGGPVSTNNINLGGVVALGSSARTIAVTSPAATATLSGTLTGSALLTKTGLGTLALTGGALNYTSGISVSAGVLSLDQTLSSFSAPITVAAAATVNLNVSTAGSIGVAVNPGGTSFSISGAGQLTKTGTAAVNVYGSFTYTGPTTIQGGSLLLSPNAVTNAAPTFGGTSMLNLAAPLAGFGLDNIGATGAMTVGNGTTPVNFMARDTFISTTRNGDFASTLNLGGTVTRSTGATGIFNFINNVTFQPSPNDSIITSNKILVGGSAGVMDQGIYITTGNMGNPILRTDYAYLDAAGFVRQVGYGVDPGTYYSAGVAPVTATSGSFKIVGNVSPTVNFVAGSGVNTFLLASPNSDLTLMSGTNVINGILRTAAGANAAGLLINSAPGFATYMTNVQGGDIDNGGKELIVRVDSSVDWLTISSKLTGTGDFTKVGSGALVISGTTANTYSGNTNLLGSGTVYLNKSGGVVAIPGNVTIGDPGSNLTVQFGLLNNYSVSSSVSANTGPATNNQIATTAVVTFNGSSTLSLNGASQTLAGIQTLSGNPVIQNGLASGNASSVLTINNSNDYNLGAGSTIRDAGSAQYANLKLVKQGAGKLTVGILANTGGVDVQGGLLALGAATSPGAVAVGTAETVLGTGFLNVASGASVDLNGFDLTVDSLTGSGVITNTSASAKTLTIGNLNNTNMSTGATSNATWSGIISDGTSAGTIALQKRGSGTETINTAQAFSGGLAVLGGTLVLDMSGLSNPNNIVRSANALSLGGNLTVIGSATLVGSQSFTGTTIVGGASEVFVNLNGGPGTTLNLGPITRTLANGTVNIGATSASTIITLGNNTTSTTAVTSGSTTVTVGSLAGIATGTQLYVSGGTGTPELVTVTATNSTNVTFTAVFANAHSGTYTVWNSGAANAVVPYLTYNGTDWAMGEAASLGGVTAYTGYTALPTITGAAAGNYVDTSTGGVTMTGALAANSIKLAPGVGATSYTWALGANAVTFGTAIGGILFDGANGSATISGSAASGQFLGSAASSELVLITNHSSGTGANTLSISAIIGGGTNNINTVTKAGTDTLVLSGANTFGGILRVNEGTVSFGTVAATGTAQPLGKGSVTLGGNAKTATLNYTGATATTWTQAITLGEAGIGQFSLTAASASTLTIGGVISGGGGLTVLTPTTSGSGLILTGTNTYLGQTIIQPGAILTLNGTTGLGASGTIANGTVVQAGGVLNLADSKITTDIVTINGSGIGGTGAITYSGTSNDESNTNFSLRSLILATNATIGSPGGKQMSIGNGFIQGNGLTLTVNSTNYIFFTNMAIDNLPTISVGGSVVLEQMTLGGGSSQTLLFTGSGKNLQLRTANVDRAINFTGGSGSITTSSRGGDNFITQNVSLTNASATTLTLDSVGNATLTINANILQGGTGAVTVSHANTTAGSSAGFVVLGGTANTFTGSLTTTGAGTLKLMPVTSTSLTNPFVSTVAVGFTANAGVGAASPQYYQALILDNGQAGSSLSQAFGALTTAAGLAPTIGLNNVTGNTLALTFASYARTAGSELLLGITGGYTTPSATNKIDFVAGLTAASQAGTFWNGTSFVIRDSGSFLRPINYSTDTGANLVNSSTTSFANTGVLTNHSNIASGGSITAQGTATIGTLAFGAGATSLMQTGGTTLTLATAGILKTGGGSSTLSGGTVQFGTASTTDAVIRVDSVSDTLTISSAISFFNATGQTLSKFGQGKLILGGTSSMTGTLNVNQGTVQLTSNAAFGTLATNAINLLTPGGAVELNGTNLSIANNMALGVSSNNSLGFMGQNTGVLRNIGGNNTVTGNISSGGYYRINSDSGTLTINNLTATASATFGGVPSSPGAVAGNITILAESTATAADWNHDGTGTLTLKLSTASAMSGKTFALQGGTTILDYTNMGTATNMLLSTEILSTQGSIFQILGKASGTTSQTFASFTPKDGITRISANANGGSGVTLNLGAVSLPTGLGTVDFLPGSGVTYQAQSGLAAVNNNGIMGTAGQFGWATAGNDWAAVTGASAPFTIGAYAGSYTEFTGANGAAATNFIISNNNPTVSPSQVANSLKIATGASATSLSIGAGLQLDVSATLVTGAGNYQISGGGVFGSTSRLNYVHLQGSGDVTINTALADNSIATAVSLTGGSTTNASANVTVASTANLAVGMGVTGTGIPANAVVSSITSSTVFVLSANATSTSSSQTYAAGGGGWIFAGTGTGQLIIGSSGSLTLSSSARGADSIFFEGGVPGTSRNVVNNGAINFNAKGSVDIGHTGTDSVVFTNNGVVSLTAGTFNVGATASAYGSYIQSSSTSIFNASGANVLFATSNTANVTDGGLSAGSASFSLSGGSFAVGGTSGTGNYMSFGGYGSFAGTQSGGTITVNRPGSIGLFLAQDGSYGASSSFTQSGGSFSVNGSSIIGGRNGAIGSYTLSGTNSTANFYQGLVVGLQDYAQGTFTQNGGTVNIGTGSNISDSTFLKGNNTIDLVLAYNQTTNPGTPATTTGTYNLNGGVLRANGITTGQGNGYTSGSLATASTFTDSSNSFTTTTGGTAIFNWGAGTLAPFDAALTIGGGVNVILTAAGAIVNTDDAAGVSRLVTFNTPITGNFGFTETGGGVLLLTSVNTYGGDTVISSGTLKPGTVGAIPSGTGKGNIILDSGATSAGTLDLNGYNLSVNGLTGSGTNAVLGQVVNNVNGVNATLTAGNNNQSSTFNGLIENNNNGGTGTLALTKVGTGDLVLGGANTYTGATILTSGALYVNGSLSTSSAVSVAAGMTFGGSGSAGAVTVGAAGIINPGLSGTGTGDLVLTGLTFSSTGTINFRNIQDGTLATTINAGVLVLSGTAPSVTLNVGAGSGAWSNDTYYKLIGYSSFSGSTADFSLTGGIPGLSSRQSASLYNDTALNQIELHITGDSPRWSGYDTTGAAVSTAWNPATATLTNWTLITGGGPTNFITGDQVLFDDVINAATDAASPTTVIVDISNGDVSPSAVTFNNTTGGTYASTAVYTLQGTNGITGSTSIVKSGNGKLIINNANSFTGGINLNGGTIVVGNASALGATSSIVTFGASSSAKLQLNNQSVILGGLTSPDATATVENGGNTTDSTLTITGTSTSIFAGTLRDGDGTTTGKLGITTGGTATLVLTGANSFTGATTIGAGSTLQVGNNGTSGTLGAGSVADAGSLVFNRSDSVTFGDSVSGIGSVTIQNGTLVLTGALNNSGTNTVNTGAILQVGNGSINGTVGNITNNGTLAFNNNGTAQTYAGNVTGLGALNITAGTLVLTGSFANTGADTISNGATLQIGDGTTNGTFASDVTDNGTLAFKLNGTPLTYGNVASGTGSLHVISGSLILNNGNSYSGGTTIDSGATLQLGTNGTAGSIIGDVVDNGTLIINRGPAVGSSASFGGNITGTGSLNLTGKAIVVLSSTGNTYSGGTNIQQGTLRAGAANVLSANSIVTVGSPGLSGSLQLFGFNQTVKGIATSGTATSQTITNNATTSDAVLTLNSSLTSTFGGAITNGSTKKTGINLLGGHTLILTGLASANTYTGITAVQSGTLQFGAANSGAGSSVITLGASGTVGLLDLAGFSGAVGGLATDPLATQNSQLVGNSGSSVNTLTLSPIAASTSIFGGIIGDNFGSGTGSLALTLNGANATTSIQVLTNTNTYTGATTLTQGILQIGNGGTVGTFGTGAVAIAANGTLLFNRSDTYTLGTGNGITGAGAITIAGGGTLDSFTTNGLINTTGALNLGGSAGATSLGNLAVNGNATVGALLVQTNSTSNDVITIASGKTLTVNGNVTVGYNTTTGGTYATNLQVTGAGAFNVSGSNATFQVGGNTGGGTSVYPTATADFSGLASMTLALGTGTLRVGDVNGNNTALTGNSPDSLVLAQTSVITGAVIALADQGRDSVMSLKLGSTATTINADTFNFGTGTRGSASFTFNTGTGTLLIRSSSGATNTAVMNIGTGGATTATLGGSANVFDVTGHSVDISLAALNIGNQARTAPMSNTFSFDTGTLSATTVTLGVHSGGAAASTQTTTVNIGGGAFNVGSGGLSLLNQSSTTAGAGDTSTLNLTGGTTTLGGDITQTVSGTAAHNGTLNLNGGTLDMGGFRIGGSAAANNIDTLIFASGTLQNVAGINNGAALNKTTTGTLVLDGANSYLGQTNVTAGIVSVRSNTGLGSTAAGTVVSNGASLELQNNITVGAESLLISGTGSASNGALRNLSGNNTYGGNVTINGGSATIQSDQDTLTLDVASGSAIAGVGQNVTFAGAGNINVADAIATTTGSVTKNNGGTLTFTGVNTYTGVTTVNGGVLQVGVNGVGSIANSAVTINTGATLSGSGTLAGTTIIGSGAILAPGDTNPATSNQTLTFTASAISLSTANSGQIQLGLTTADLVDSGFADWYHLTGGTAAQYVASLNGGAGTIANTTWNNGHAGDHDFISAAGTIILGTSATTDTRISVSLNNLTGVTYGSVFNLLDWSTAGIKDSTALSGMGTGGFNAADNLLLASLGSGLSWDTSLFNSNGILVVVPEPSRVFFLLLGLLGLMTRRRRRW